MLCAELLSLRSFEEWLAGERRRKAQETAESEELEEAAMAQVGRPRQRWCIGSGEFKESVEEKVLCDLTACTYIWTAQKLTLSTARHQKDACACVKHYLTCVDMPARVHTFKVLTLASAMNVGISGSISQV